MNKALTGIIIALFSIQSFAIQTDENRTITRVAVEPSDRGYIKVSEGLTLSCKYNVVYFDVASSSGKGYLSVILAARMADVKVAITYDIDTSNNCSLSTIAID